MNYINCDSQPKEFRCFKISILCIWTPLAQAAFWCRIGSPFCINLPNKRLSLNQSSRVLNRKDPHKNFRHRHRRFPLILITSLSTFFIPRPPLDLPRPHFALLSLSAYYQLYNRPSQGSFIMPCLLVPQSHYEKSFLSSNDETGSTADTEMDRLFDSCMDETGVTIISNTTSLVDEPDSDTEDDASLFESEVRHLLAYSLAIAAKFDVRLESRQYS